MVFGFIEPFFNVFLDALQHLRVSTGGQKNQGFVDLNTSIIGFLSH